MLLQDILLGQATTQLANQLLENQPMQVILCSAYSFGDTLDYQNLLQQLSDAGYTENAAELFPMENVYAIILKGNHIIRKFREFSDKKLQDDPNIPWIQPCPSNIFLCCGRLVESTDQLHCSYEDAHQLLTQRFLCSHDQQILFPEDLQKIGDRSLLTNLLLESYVSRLSQYIQTFNRNYTSHALEELNQIVRQSNDTPNAIRLFFSDLYLQIKEQMRALYPDYTISFYSNSHIIRTIFRMNTLDEIICFLAQRFDMIMSSIGAFSRESVLDDIVHYIHRNYQSNITLENIAPLFGYNHSYLGKIFRKKTGQSFNEYMDRLRIDHAKELLLQDNAKVYIISERVGYKNVDYFHVKFRKYVNMSPAEFRKMHSANK